MYVCPHQPLLAIPQELALNQLGNLSLSLNADKFDSLNGDGRLFQHRTSALHIPEHPSHTITTMRGGVTRVSEGGEERRGLTRAHNPRT